MLVKINGKYVHDQLLAERAVLAASGRAKGADPA